jgi:hypothetical protein
MTITERAALVTALAPRQLCAPLRAARRQLRRFLAPLEDVAVSLGLPESTRRKVQRSVLLGMLERDSAWGCWDASTWIEVAHSAGFYKANTLAVAARLGVLNGGELSGLAHRSTELGAVVEEHVRTSWPYAPVSAGDRHWRGATHRGLAP